MKKFLILNGAILTGALLGGCANIPIGPNSYQEQTSRIIQESNLGKKPVEIEIQGKKEKYSLSLNSMLKLQERGYLPLSIGEDYKIINCENQSKQEIKPCKLRILESALQKNHTGNETAVFSALNYASSKVRNQQEIWMNGLKVREAVRLSELVSIIASYSLNTTTAQHKLNSTFGKGSSNNSNYNVTGG